MGLGARGPTQPSIDIEFYVYFYDWSNHWSSVCHQLEMNLLQWFTLYHSSSIAVKFAIINLLHQPTSNLYKEMSWPFGGDLAFGPQNPGTSWSMNDSCAMLFDYGSAKESCWKTIRFCRCWTKQSWMVPHCLILHWLEWHTFNMN